MDSKKRTIKYTKADLEQGRANRDQVARSHGAKLIADLADHQQRSRSYRDMVAVVLEKLRMPVFKELEEQGYSPLLKVACLIVKEHKEHMGWNRQGYTDVPEWILQKSMEAQTLKPNKPKGKHEEDADEVKTTIRTLLAYDYVQHLKKKNNKRLNADELLEKLGGPKRDAIKKQREKAVRLLGRHAELNFNGEDYFVFDVDTTRIEREFKTMTALRKVII